MSTKGGRGCGVGKIMENIRRPRSGNGLPGYLSGVTLRGKSCSRISTFVAICNRTLCLPYLDEELRFPTR